jgi:small subunit ribosomal protein S1
VHISEMAAHHVDMPDQVVTPGEELWVKIIDLDLERRRISLSIKQAAEGGTVAAEYQDMYGEHAYDEEGNYIGPAYEEHAEGEEGAPEGAAGEAGAPEGAAPEAAVAEAAAPEAAAPEAAAPEAAAPEAAAPEAAAPEAAAQETGDAEAPEA